MRWHALRRPVPSFATIAFMTSQFFAAVFLFLCVPALLSRLLRVEKVFPLVFVQLLLGIAVNESCPLAWLKTREIDFLAGPLGFSLQGLGWLGVVILIALAGAESMSREARTWRFVPISVAGFSVTCLLGSLVGYQLVHHFAGVAGADTTALRCALALGVTLSVTALPVLIAILRDTGMAATAVGKLAVNCAMLDDVWLWLGIALILSLGSRSPHALTIFPLFAAYIAAMFLLVRPLLLRWYRSRPAAADLHVVLEFVGLICFSAMLTDLIGLHALFGAFLGGVIFPKSLLQTWRAPLLLLSQTLLLPFYFILTGMRLQLDVSDPAFWLLTAIVTTAAMVGKFTSVAIAARCTGLSWRESGMLGCLMQCKGLMELIAINIFFDAGIIGPQIYSALAMMALISTLVTAPGLAWLGRGEGVAGTRPAAQP